jgi:hypothetical protein
MFLQAVPSRVADDELVVHVTARCFSRKNNPCGQAFPVLGRISPPGFGPLIKMAEFHAKNCRLNRIKPEVSSQEIAFVSGPETVLAKPADTICQFRTVGRDHASIAGSTEILRGKETEATRIPDGARAPPVPFRSNRLCGVLNDGDLMAGSLADYFIHLRYLSKQVNGNYGSRPFRDSGFDSSRIDIKGFRVNVHEHRYRA